MKKKNANSDELNQNKEALPPAESEDTPSKEEQLMDELAGFSDVAMDDDELDGGSKDNSDSKDNGDSTENAVVTDEGVVGIVPSASPEKTGSKKKVPVMYGVKKLPSMFRRSYSEKSFKNRILKKIYVAEDKERIHKIFEVGANPKRPELLAVRQDSIFSKKEVNF
ncbi:MAG: hypothetical protein J6Y30_07295 [Treponema sp.]|nr:hypothetical protein [Treponema sp.]